MHIPDKINLNLTLKIVIRLHRGEYSIHEWTWITFFIDDTDMSDYKAVRPGDYQVFKIIEIETIGKQYHFPAGQCFESSLVEWRDRDDLISCCQYIPFKFLMYFPCT